jgi:hypothetical protein
MIIDREFMIFENDMSWRRRKRIQLFDADDFQRTRFSSDEW